MTALYYLSSLIFKLGIIWPRRLDTRSYITGKTVVTAFLSDPVFPFYSLVRVEISKFPMNVRVPIHFFIRKTFICKNSEPRIEKKKQKTK